MNRVLRSLLAFVVGLWIGSVTACSSQPKWHDDPFYEIHPYGDH